MALKNKWTVGYELNELDERIAVHGIFNGDVKSFPIKEIQMVGYTDIAVMQSDLDAVDINWADNYDVRFVMKFQEQA